jgi:O-antigen/teichoic acid export membrane protein
MAAAFAANQAVASFVLAYFGPPQAVGVYRVAELGASLVAMPLGALAIHYSADISRLIQQCDPVGLRAKLRQAARIAIAAACPVALAFLFFGRDLIEVAFGGTYDGAALPLAILCLAQIVNTLTGLAGIVMSMGGHHRESVVAVLAAMAMQLGLCLWLVPSHSVMGAAIASAAATLVWSQILRLRVRRHYRVNTLPI